MLKKKKLTEKQIQLIKMYAKKASLDWQMCVD